MGISGLGNFNSASFSYEHSQETKSANKDSKPSFSLDKKEEKGTAAPGKTISISEVMKMMEESRKLTAQQLKDGDDWRSMSAEEWDKMLDGVDKEIEAIRKYIEEMKEAQEEAAQKAAAEAAPEMKAAAASSAALAVASGFGSEPAVEGEEGEGEVPLEGDHEKNWTKRLETDDQTILRTAKEAQKMERMATAKLRELANGEYSKHFSYEEVSQVYREQKEKTEEI